MRRALRWFACHVVDLALVVEIPVGLVGWILYPGMVMATLFWMDVVLATCLMSMWRTNRRQDRTIRTISQTNRDQFAAAYQRGLRAGGIMARAAMTAELERRRAATYPTRTPPLILLAEPGSVRADRDHPSPINQPPVDG